MAAQAPSRARAPRLNPFAFPSDTDFRFVLLIVTVLGASLFLYNGLYLSFPGMGKSYLLAYSECMKLGPDLASLDFGASLSLDPGSLDIVHAAEASARCTARVEAPRVAWMLGGLVGLLLIAGALYWVLPAWKIRRGRLVPLSEEDAPEVVAYLAELSREAGLSRPPTFVWNPFNPASSGVAFGRFGRYYVALTGGLVTLFYTDQAAFRAIMLHELAHLRNADVDKTYFTVAIWQAFLLAALIPYAVVLVTRLSDNWDLLLSLGWRSLALAVLVYLMRNAVLRAREVYADVRASIWDGRAGALGRMLEGLPHPKRSRWLGAWQVHPDPAVRRQTLDDTSPLFRLRFWDAFATGLAASIAYPNIFGWLQGVTSGANQFVLAPLLTVLILAPLLTGVVGAGVWRATLAALVRGQAPEGLGRMALGLGLGLLLGQMLGFDAVVEEGMLLESLQTADLAGLGAFLSSHVIWSILLLVGLFFFLRWVGTGAALWLEVVTTARSPRLACLAGLTISGGVLALWLGMLFSMRVFLDSQLTFGLSFAEGFGLALIPVAFLVIAVVFLYSNVLTLLVLISLWAFPLATWFWRGRMAAAAASSWAYLDASPESLAVPRLAQVPSLHPRLAIAVGLAGSMLYCALVLVIRALRLAMIPEAVRDSDEGRVVFFVGTIGLAVVMQVGVAAVAAASVRRLGALHGLFAAFVAGSVMTAGNLGLNLLFGGSADLHFIWLVFTQMVELGALFALPTALAVSALAGWLRRPRQAADAELRPAGAG